MLKLLGELAGRIRFKIDSVEYGHRRGYMDKKLETANAEKVKRKVSNLLKEYGFSRTKKTFYTRVLDDRIEFVHIHKFTFGPLFRVHIGIRFLCDEFDAVALNGPDSDSYRYKNKNVSMKYWLEEETLDRCANKILAYIKEVGLLWLEKWRNVDLLLTSADSPLKGDMPELYKKMVRGNGDVKVHQRSLALLGIKSF